MYLVGTTGVNKLRLHGTAKWQKLSNLLKSQNILIEFQLADAFQNQNPIISILIATQSYGANDRSRLQILLMQISL